ncbi:MAG: hypothetical protein IPM74_17950 [Crocinitomicaceae bacterium]|nr:hypothetical protein [Crocinitomicaceae bacterium]MBK8927728.1 hypothetical protein [Crocinitomicaceae bacterium]
MGDSVIQVINENSESKSEILFINVHENELTSVEAYRKFDLEKKYQFIWLQHNITRRIYFNHHDVVYSVDPNRIFTHAGIEETIAYDTLFSRKAERMAKSFAHDILKLLRSAGWVISLHNNTPDNYSIFSYQVGGDEYGNAAQIHIDQNMDPDDFIFTTDKNLYDHLSQLPVNIILQDNNNCKDDGSLSVYCGRKGIPYVNIEAEYGHLTEQVKLIEMVVSEIVSMNE